ncbi:heterokaryon incompatibility protein-domain-containing protein [Cladorrhinum sp. PSN332]|nr:heterokaryon incompatibility protein-domain-containing protein [Cladorrhinum sp. PSN332]
MSDRHSVLGNGEWLLVGQSLFSPDGNTEFKCQSDGKVAVYNDGSCVFQNTDEQRHDVKGVKMQEDGNLVLYDHDGNALWHTDTAGPSGNTTTTLAVQNDGNVVLYNGTPIYYKAAYHQCLGRRVIPFQELQNDSSVSVRSFVLGSQARIQASAKHCRFCQFIIRAVTLSRMLNTRSSTTSNTVTALAKLEDPERNLILEWMTNIVPGGRPGFALNGVYLAFISGPPGTSRNSMSYLLPSLESQIDMSRISGWIVRCTTNHSTCLAESHHTGADFDAIFPGLHLLRLLDVVENCLVERQEPARYVALSYVWGAAMALNFRLTTANKPVLMKPGAVGQIWDLLPTTIQDSIMLVRKLGLRYLWVDALCLLQNDLKDLEHGVSVMDQIYEQSWLTVVAAHGHDANAGLPGVEIGTRFEQVPDSCEVKPGQSLGFMASPDLLLKRTVYDTRAWTFQEELLSRRTLYFFGDQVVFSCRESRCLETCVDDRTPTGGTSNGMDVSLLRVSMLMEYPVQNYATMLMYYTQRVLTNNSDALRALEGIMRRFTLKMGYRMLQGMPIGSFDLFILFSGTNLHRRPAFPSYSWAGWVGGVDVHCWHVTNLNEWLKDRTWIIWHKRSPSGVVSLVWDPAANESFPVKDMTFQGYRQRTRFRCPMRRISTLRIAPSENMKPSAGVVDQGTPSPSYMYPLLQFWTLAVFLRLEIVDVFQPQGRLFGNGYEVGWNGKECGTVRLDGFVARTSFFERSDEQFEVLILSETGRGETDTGGGFYNVMLIEWIGGVAERRGVGEIVKEGVSQSFAPGPVWKEVLLG